MNKQTEQPKLVRALVNLGIITAEGALKVSESGNSPQKLFEELHIIPKISKENGVIRYHTTGIDIFVGDIFDINIDMVGLLYLLLSN